MKKVSIIIPCRNEEENVAAFYSLAEQTLEPGFFYQFIFVNDGSSDQTLAEIRKLIEMKNLSGRSASSPIEADFSVSKDAKKSSSSSDAADFIEQENGDSAGALNANQNIPVRGVKGEIIGINFSRNFGKEAAILAGLEKADGDYIALIDADLQQHPKYINQMVAQLEQDPDLDMVACYQEKRRESRLLSGFKNLFYRLINRVSDTKFEKNASDFRTFRKNVADSILEMDEYHRFSKGLFAWIGFKVAYMPYQVGERLHGKTNWSFRSLTRYALDGFFDYSIVPLRIATFLGFFTSFAAIVYLIVVLIQKFVGGIAIEGYATIVSLILLLSGVQLICLGIVGEYLARTYMQSKQRPHFIIKNIYHTEEAENERITKILSD